MILGDADSATFAGSIPKRYPERTVIGTAASQPVILQLQSGAVKNALAAAGVDLTNLRQATSPVSRELPALNVAVEMSDTITSSLTAPNTVGILEGSDPTAQERVRGFLGPHGPYRDHPGAGG